MAPALTLIEQAVLKKAMSIFGYPEGSDGIFSPGGSISNMYGVILARYDKFPNVKEDGMASLPRLALFTSEDVIFLSNSDFFDSNVQLILISGSLFVDEDIQLDWFGYE